MTAYDQAIKVAQRFLYGYLHHAQLASFFGLMDIFLWEDSQNKNALQDVKKRKEMDEFIVENYKKFPNYPVPNADSVAAEFKTATADTIKANEKAWLKKGFEELIKYEKETIQLFENLEKQSTEAKDEKLSQKIKQYGEDVKKELQKIESINNQLQKVDYDFDKFVKEYNKGDNDMPRYEDEMQRRGGSRSEMEGEEGRYPSMGFTSRYYPYSPFMPYLESESRHRDPMREREKEYERLKRELEEIEMEMEDMEMDMEMQRRGGRRGGGRRGGRRGGGGR